VNPCPFCGERFTTRYTYGQAYACQTLVIAFKADSRTHQTKDCLRGEVAKLTAENAALTKRLKEAEGAR